MRKSILLFLIILTPNFLVNAQDQPKKRIIVSPGLCFSTFGRYGVLAVHDESYPEFSLNSFYSSGISIFFKTKKMLEIETGIYYSYHSINIDQPWVSTDISEKIELFELPINFRIDFPYFYLSSGFLFDIQLNNTEIIDNQTGIGMNTGCGVSYKFKHGVLVYAGPIFYFHSIVPSKSTLTGISLKIGVAFD